jgi:hypothetical protein
MIQEINPVTDSRWPSFSDKHRRSSVFHTCEWLNVIRKTYGHEPAALVTVGPDDSLLAGVVFCRVSSPLTGRRMISIPFSDHCEPLVGSDGEFDQLLTAYEERIRAERCRYAELRLTSTIRPNPDWQPSEIFYLHRLDLRPGPTAIFRKFHRNCVQRRISHAERECLTVREGRDPDTLKAFYELVLQTRRRHLLPPQPRVWFQNVLECMGDRANIRLAYKSDRPIAGILTLQHRRTLYYKYGGSDACFHHLGAIPYLFWHAIQAAAGRGVEELDLGRSSRDNPGLITFKERWNSERSELHYMRSPARPTKPLYPGLRSRTLAQIAFRTMPNGFLTGLGTLLYRHTD